MARVQSTTSKSINLPQLASELGGAGVSGPDIATCLSNASKTIWADNITQAALDNGIAAHAANPDFGTPPKQLNLKNAVTSLRQWSTDVATESGAWAGQNTAQRDAAMATMFTRLGVLLDRMADVIETAGWG